MPTQTLGIGSFDGDALAAGVSPNFLMPLALLSHITFWTDFTKLTPIDRVAVTGWDRWYQQHRAGIGPLDYELTKADPAKGAWLALEPWSGKSGYVFAFRQASGPASMSVRLQGLQPNTTYEIADVGSGQPLARELGRVLQAGYELRLPKPWSAEVLRVKPVPAGPSHDLRAGAAT
jgi:hypothetical protein